MKKTLGYALHLMGREQRRRWLLLVVLALVVSGFEMLGAALVYALLGLIVDPSAAIVLPGVGDVRTLVGDMEERHFLLVFVVLMGIFFLFRSLVQMGVTYAQQRVAHNFGARLSNRLLEGYLRQPYTMHLQRSSAELIRNGHQAVRDLVVHVFLPLIRVAAETLVTAGMLVVLIVIAPLATALAVIVVGGAAALLLLVVQPHLRRLGRSAHEMSQYTLAAMQQALHGIRDIKVLGREREFARRYGQGRLRLARSNYLASTVGELPRAVIETSLIVFILLFFGLTVAGGVGTEETLSTLGLFAYVGLRLQPSLQRIINGFNELKYSAAPLEDIYSDLCTTETLPPNNEAIEPLSFQDSLILDGVSFRYEGGDAEAVSQVSLSIRPGEVIGICGPTGGGKTTLVDVISGLLEPTSGTVRVDGKNLRGNVRAWQAQLGIVAQVVFLTDDTLRNNIALGVPKDQIDEEAVTEAVNLSQLSDFVESLSKGLDTVVGEHGVRISGGQRQRIAIARALYRRPKVLIFDEGTSALDNATESQLMASVDRLRGNQTIILIAHRLSTVRNSDRVVFVERGQVTGIDSFEDLRRTHAAFDAMVARE